MNTDNDVKAKGCALLVMIAFVAALVVTISYVNSLNPETITGEVLDKDKVVITQVHSGKGYFFVTYSTTYRVELRKDSDEVTEKFSTNYGTYDTLKIGQTGEFRVSGLRSMGRVLRAK